MLLKTQGIRKMFTMPVDVLNDNRLSIGAKGLYTQILYSNDDICSLEDLTKLSTTPLEELKTYFAELTTVGYVEMNNKQAKLKNTAPKSVENVEEKVKEAEEYAETTQAPKLSIYDKIKIIIDGYELTQNVKNLLLVYFEARLGKKGRFAESDDLHANQVRAMIGDLVSFHLSEDDQITCVQTAIDKQWFKFVKPVTETQVATTTKLKSTFDKTQLRSGTYSLDDIADITRKAAELEASGQQGVF